VPELPEVEVIKGKLQLRTGGRELKGVEPVWAKFGNLSWDEVLGRRVRRWVRRGKALFLDVGGPQVVRFHMRLEGRFFFGEGAFEELRHVYLRMDFEGVEPLYFGDPRKLATVEIGSPSDLLDPEGGGVEPLTDEFGLDLLEDLASRFPGRKVKSLLMDQSLISGIGNTYADEILFRAGVMPDRRMGELSEEELGRVLESAKGVLRRALELGGMSEYTRLWRGDEGGRFDAEIAVHGRKGLPCPGCGGSVERMTIDGRGTYYCRSCQR